MNVLTSLKNGDNLSSSEQAIADDILEHPADILEMSASELAKACFVSQSTVYRLCDKIGVSGFAKLKVGISTSLDQYLNSHGFDFDFPVKQHQTHYEIMTNLKTDYIKTIDATFSHFDLEQLRLSVSAMMKAESIDVYASSANIYFAQNFAFQMAEIGAHVNVPVDEYHQRLCAASSDTSHLAIIISFGGRGVMVESIVDILKITQTPVLLICAADFQGFDVDYRLPINPYENHYRKISSFSTRLSILYILDILYTCYFERQYEINIKKKVSYYALISQYNPKKR